MYLVSLQMGIPGAAELAILVVMLLFWVGVIVAIVFAVKRLLGGSDEQRVAELEDRVAELEAAVEESGPSGDDGE